MLAKYCRGLGAVVGLVVLLGATQAFASAISVGTGSNRAEVYIEFQDGASYLFDVAFEEPISGLGLFDIIEAAQPLTTVRQNFGWGEFVDGISFDGHSNVGFGGGDNWWHYWTREAGEDWISPWVGAADRIVSNGSADGWIYGHGAAPLPEPATVGLMLLGAAVLFRRRSQATRSNGF